MKRTYNFVTAIIFFTFVFSGIGKSQDLQETLNNLSGTSAKAYLSPVISGFGANLNSGWVHKSPSSKLFGIDLEVGFVGMGTMMNDKDKTFISSGTFKFNNEKALILINNSAQTRGLPQSYKDGLANEIAQKEFTVGISGPTIVGSKGSEVMVNFSGTEVSYNGQTYNIDPQSISTGAKGYLDNLPILPLFASQFSIGTVYGTMATFRFLPSVEIKKLGKFSYIGFGLQHNPAMFLHVPLPVDISAAFFTQSMNVGDIFKASATSFGIYASKTFGFGITITPFAGIAVESSSIDVAYNTEYTYSGQTIKDKIAFTMKGENSTRMTIGASLKLGMMNISADYSLTKYNAASAGINFIF